MRLRGQSAPPVRLRAVERLVGTRQGCFEILFCRLHLSKAHAERAVLERRCACTTTIKQSFGNPMLPLTTRRKQQDELVASYPGQRSGLRISNACGFTRDPLQNSVPSFQASSIRKIVAGMTRCSPHGQSR